PGFRRQAGPGEQMAWARRRRWSGSRHRQADWKTATGAEYGASGSRSTGVRRRSRHLYLSGVSLEASSGVLERARARAAAAALATTGVRRGEARARSKQQKCGACGHREITGAGGRRGAGQNSRNARRVGEGSGGAPSGLGSPRAGWRRETLSLEAADRPGGNANSPEIVCNGESGAACAGLVVEREFNDAGQVRPPAVRVRARFEAAVDVRGSSAASGG